MYTEGGKEKEKKKNKVSRFLFSVALGGKA